MPLWLSLSFTPLHALPLGALTTHVHRRGSIYSFVHIAAISLSASRTNALIHLCVFWLQRTAEKLGAGARRLFRYTRRHFPAFERTVFGGLFFLRYRMAGCLFKCAARRRSGCACTNIVHHTHIAQHTTHSLIYDGLGLCARRWQRPTHSSCLTRRLRRRCGAGWCSCPSCCRTSPMTCYSETRSLVSIAA